MAIKIVCVGRLKEPFYQEACAEYLKRLSRLMPATVAEVADEPEPESLSPKACEQVKEREAQRMLARVSPGEHVVALCVGAKEPTSEELAARLQALFVGGRPNVTFLVGGSLGLGASALARADERMGLSRLTLPHQLCRVVLLEQLFRAGKINAGERYHK